MPSQEEILEDDIREIVKADHQPDKTRKGTHKGKEGEKREAACGDKTGKTKRLRLLRRQ